MSPQRAADVLERVTRLPIRIKLAVSLIALLLIGGGLAAFEVTRRVEREARLQAEAHAETLLSMMAYSLSAPLLFEDSTGIQQVLDAAVSASEVERVRVFGLDGGLRGQYRRSSNDAPGRINLDSASIIHGGDRIGTIELGLSRERLESHVAASQRALLRLLAILMLAGMAAVFLLSSLITRPLLQMLDAVQRIAAGDLSQRVPVPGQDEVGVLAAAFNSMLERLERAYGELRDANRRLESRVQKRTAQLREEVAERHRTEEALHITESRFRLMFEAAVVGVALFDGDGTLLESNPALSRMLGVDELRSGPDLRRALNADEKPELLRLWRDVIEGRIDQFQRETRLERADGTHLFALITVSRAGDADRRADFVLGMVENITELKAFEERFRQTQRLESIGRLAGGIAHDFNNLLTAINGISDVALSDLDDQDPVHRDLREIRRAGERAAALTRQLLAFSRQQVLQPRVLNLNDVVTDMASMLRRLIGENISLELRLDNHLPPVLADGGQMSQVIMNLAVNARDAMPEGGRLLVETFAMEITAHDADRFGTAGAGEHVVLRVRDNGCGMDGATRSRIFEPFFTTKKLGQATGLGLATVYGIVKQSDGGIHVDSSPGSGTCFTVVLPRTCEVACSDDVLPAAIVRPGTECILVVEDEPAVRALIARVLQRAGYRVAQAGNGREALEVIARDALAVDLLITDVVMPEIGGPELVAALRTTRAALPVLYISGYSPDDVVQRGVFDQTASFLQKPMTPVELTSKVRQILDRTGTPEPV